VKNRTIDTNAVMAKSGPRCAMMLQSEDSGNVQSLLLTASKMKLKSESHFSQGVQLLQDKVDACYKYRPIIYNVVQ
jgi:hypothetical protein